MRSHHLVLVLAIGCGTATATQDVPLSRADFVTVDGSQLVYHGAPIRLKGHNLESFVRDNDTIWRNFDGYRGDLDVLLDRARDLGSNTIRLTFPDNALRFESDGSVTAGDLDKVGRMLDDLGARGMGAILTVFNRHDYANADRTRDAAKVRSFVQRFGQDPRVVMWDIVNEPPVANPDTRAAVLGWITAMRAAFDGAAQPITIGNVGHWDADLAAPGLSNTIGLSDVISIHCYGRYKEGFTPPFADGVAYRDDTFCGAVVQYLRNRTDKPIVMEEFGWPDAPSVQWPPNPMHPWRFHDFPTTPSSADDFYAQLLGALDTKGVAGAINWQIQDTSGDGWGLVGRDFQPKRTGDPGSAHERFRAWGGPAAHPFDFPAPGFASGLFRDTSTMRISRPQFPDGDWDACRGKLDCANGEAVVGISTDTTDRYGNAGLCHQEAGLSGQLTERLDLDGFVDRRRAQRQLPGLPTSDWAPGFYKLECGGGEYVVGVSENANQCQHDNHFHAVLCARGPGGLGTCSLRSIDGGGDDRGNLAARDWDRDHFKAECAADELMAGISVDPNSFRPHSLLCCRP